MSDEIFKLMEKWKNSATLKYIKHNYIEEIEKEKDKITAIISFEYFDFALTEINHVTYNSMDVDLNKLEESVNNCLETLENIFYPKVKNYLDDNWNNFYFNPPNILNNYDFALMETRMDPHTKVCTFNLFFDEGVLNHKEIIFNNDNIHFGYDTEKLRITHWQEI